MLQIYKNHPIYKLTFLKKMSTHQSIYQPQILEEEIQRKATTQFSNKHAKVNGKSIVHLSSMLQDQKEHPYSPDLKELSLLEQEQEEDNTFAVEVQDPLSVNKFKELSKKHNKRYLSELIWNHQKPRQTFQRFKTQNISQLISDKKLRPINNLKVGRKNLSFSIKNKRQLSHDFYEFVQHKTKGQEVTPEKQKRTKIFTKRKDSKGSNHFSIKLGRKNKSTFRRRPQGELSLQKSPEKRKKEDCEEHGLAFYLKQLTINIPKVREFKWSKLTKNPFNVSQF